MKRILWLLLCTLLTLAVLASCTGNGSTQVPMPELSGNPELSLEVVSMESTWREKTVTVRLTNRTDHEMLYGRNYQLLRYDGTSWESATYIPSLWDRTHTLVAYRLEPGESQEVTFTLTSRHFVNRATPYCLTMRFSEEKGKEEYTCGVLLEPGAWE